MQSTIFLECGKKNNKNMKIIHEFLQSLHIYHSRHFLNELRQSMPYSFGFHEIKTILEQYGVKTIGLQYEDKINANLPLPAILHMGSTFVVCKDIKDENIIFSTEGTLTQRSISDFCEHWTGKALIIKEIDRGGEPNLIKNLFIDLVNEYSIVFIFILPILFLKAYNEQCIISSINLPLFLLDIFGIIFCIILLQKQNNNTHRFGDKICSLIKNHNCDNVITTKAAKIFDILSWAEIGFAYYYSRLLFSMVDNITKLNLISLVAILFSVWSVWYQKVVVKSLCTLCLCVLFILWCQAAVCLDSFIGNNYHLFIKDIILYSFVFIGVLLLINFINRYIAMDKMYSKVENNFRAIKSDRTVLDVLLKKTSKTILQAEESNIMFGNKNAKHTITIITNPHCRACGDLHSKIIKMQNSMGDICIRYVFVSFDGKLECSNKALIATYLHKPHSETLHLYEEWFANGKNNPDKFIKDNKLDINSKDVLNEFLIHKKWEESHNIDITPKIFIDENPLPYFYNLEDIVHIYR